MDLIELADQGYGKSVVKTAGDISFSCTSPSNLPDVLSFNNGMEYLKLPKWNSLSSGNLGKLIFVINNQSGDEKKAK